VSYAMKILSLMGDVKGVIILLKAFCKSQSVTEPERWLFWVGEDLRMLLGLCWVSAPDFWFGDNF